MKIFVLQEQHLSGAATIIAVAATRNLLLLELRKWIQRRGDFFITALNENEWDIYQERGSQTIFKMSSCLRIVEHNVME